MGVAGVASDSLAPSPAGLVGTLVAVFFCIWDPFEFFPPLDSPSRRFVLGVGGRFDRAGDVFVAPAAEGGGGAIDLA
jgi:hypothetical protein